MSRSDSVFLALPDPGRAATLDEVAEGLRLLKLWAGDPSYEWIKDRVNAAWRAAGRPDGDLAGKTTVVDCFKAGRRRLNVELVIAVVRALHPDAGYVAQWRQALRVAGGEVTAAAQVRVLDRLPEELAGFAGRSAELDQLRQALRRGCADGGAVVVSAIAGMAGVGKTQLAIRAGHALIREGRCDRVLFVNLRGFDPAQPPADPAAVLDGFLRLLGVPGQRIPHGLEARAGAYRDRLAGTRTLVVLDNTAGAGQVRPLLPGVPGCPVLVTSRRDLTALQPAARLAMDVFTPAEAIAFLAVAAPGTGAGDDPGAAARITRRCGYLPLALGLVAAHIRATPGWTLTDHAARLDERHHGRRLDTGVELALDLSYQHLPAEQRRLLRLAALHPGQDLDAHAAAALTGGAVAVTGAGLDGLRRDYLMQRAAPGRYTFHDLVRAYAAGRASDEDSPTQRRAALTRLFGYYLAAAAAAMDTLYPAETHRRPRVPAPATPVPDLTGPDAARDWLDTERPTLVAVAAHTAAHGWPTHTTALSATLFRYLDGGYPAEALAIHGHALQAAQLTGDPAGQAHALNGLGTAQLRLGRYGPAAEHFDAALGLFGQDGDPAGQARALGSLGNIEKRLGRYQLAIDHHERALDLHRQAGDRAGEARALGNLGVIEMRLGRHDASADHHGQALALCRAAGDEAGEADTLNNLGCVELRLGRTGAAADHLQQGLALHRQLGNRAGEARTLDSLGNLHLGLGQPAEAIGYHRQALAILREVGQWDSEAWALNALGEATRAAGSPADALAHHTAAHAIATATGNRDQQARAHAGLGRTHCALGDTSHARQHFQHAMALYTDLGAPDADQISAHLAAIEDGSPDQG